MCIFMLQSIVIKNLANIKKNFFFIYYFSFLMLSTAKFPKLSQQFFHALRCCATSSSSSAVSSELHAQSADLLRDIVNFYANEKGRTFFLPTANDVAMEQMLLPFQRLLSLGIRTEFLSDSCTKSEGVFKALTTNGQSFLKKLECLVECLAMPYEDAIRFYARWSSDLSSVPVEHIQRVIGVFSGRGVLAGPQMAALIRKCPQLLFGKEPQKMDLFWEHIAYFFTGSSTLHNLMMYSPHICLMDPLDVEEKYEYIYYHMGIEPEELVESRFWMDMSLEQIMMRHELLKRTGKYTFPDPKKPQLKKENPLIPLIFDIPDTEFATDVAGVSNEEWMVFQEMFRQEQNLADLDRPYEKIKPSLRKRIELKPKSVEKVEGELE